METTTQPQGATIDDKVVHTLEFDKVIAMLSERTSFSAGREAALALRPSTLLAEANQRQAETEEAIRLLELKPSTTLGGARDIRPSVSRARRGGVLEPSDLLEIGSTLASARGLRGLLVKLVGQFPLLADIGARLQPSEQLEREIGRCINDRGEVTDDASPTLRRIRIDIRIAYDRLMDRLQDFMASHRTVVQEPIITSRDGRYVIPIRADSRGQVRGIIHDQSASGATVFMEPLATLDLNNRLRELQLDEQREVQRILAELSSRVGALAEPLTATVEALAELDLVLARAHLAAEQRAIRPQLVAGRSPDEATNLKAARHPLLRGHVVPIDVRLGPEFRILVITGPNTGGKTVALKTVGLLTLMAQAGLHIPAAEGSTVRVFHQVFADIGDEQSIEQSLSTFSSHMTHIVAILERVDADSLVLLDELGAGTDPTEGSALARAILLYLLKRGVTTLATTHYSEIKAFAHLTPGVQNANVEFDVETLAPTYRLRIGLPGRSNALAIATRLGLPAEIIEAARGMINPGEQQVEELLAQIQSERESAERARERACRDAREAEEVRRRLASELRRLEAERERILEETRAEAQRQLADVYEEIRRAAAYVRTEQASREALTHTARSLEAARQKLRERARPRSEAQPEGGEAPAALGVGGRVLVNSLGQQGQITALFPERGEAEVQLGGFKLRARLDDLAPLGTPTEERPRYEQSLPTLTRTPSIELDLRGNRAEEAIQTLDEYLDDAVLGGLRTVRVIHGKGTGALRQAIRAELARHALVTSYRSGEAEEGGDGVTIVTLAGD